MRVQDQIEILLTKSACRAEEAEKSAIRGMFVKNPKTGNKRMATQDGLTARSNQHVQLAGWPQAVDAADERRGEHDIAEPRGVNN